MPGLTHRLANTGTLQTNTYFDERYQFDLGSLSFNGSGYLTTPYSTTRFDWYTAGVDYTIECWIYPTSYTGWNSGGTGTLIGNMGTGYNAWSFGLGSTNLVTFQYFNNVTNVFITGPAVVPPLNTWSHIAMTRTSSGITVFLNGVAGTTTAISGTPVSGGANAPLAVGNWQISFIRGSITNLRVVKGTAIYTGNFTPPTAPLTAVTNTQLLLNTLTTNPFVDNSINNNTFTVNGTVTSNTIIPFLIPVTQTKFTANTIIGQLDEVSKISGPTFRLSNTGMMTITGSGQFDEYNSITPPPTQLSLFYTDKFAVSNSYSQFTLPSSITQGDLIVLFAAVGNSSASTDIGLNGPAGYTTILEDWGSSSATVDIDRYSWFYKVAKNTDAGSTISWTPVTGGSNFREGYIFGFRGNNPVFRAQFGSINKSADKLVSAPTTPATQVVNSSSQTALPTITFAHWHNSSGTVSVRGFSPTSNTILNNGTGSYTGFSIANTNTQNASVSMTITGGNYTYMSSFYLSVT